MELVILDIITMDTQGRITIPKYIRDKYSFSGGTEFLIKDEEKGIIIAIPRTRKDALSLFQEVLENISKYQSALASNVTQETTFEERLQDRDTKRLEKLVTADE